MTPVTSSNIHAIGHDPVTNTLKVQFKDKSGAPTATWEYDGVPAEKHAALMAATPSIGSHFAKNIKGQHEGRKVE
jgi:hypothetical protein